MTNDVRRRNAEVLHERQAAGRLALEADWARGHRIAAISGSLKAEQPVPFREHRLLTEQIKPTGQKSAVNQQHRCSHPPARELKLHAPEASHLWPDSKAAARGVRARSSSGCQVHVRYYDMKVLRMAANFTLLCFGMVTPNG